jgi:AsmA protein
LLGVAAVVVVAVGVGAVVLARFDPNTLKPRIEAAVRQATGRDLGLYGPISVKLSLWPTVELRDVTFANPPGYSRPQMATLDRLELRLAVLPLLRRQFEIARLVLVHPDILLEVDAQGHPNWQLTPTTLGLPPGGGSPGPNGSPLPSRTGPAAGGAPPDAGASTSGRTSTEISFHDVQIEDGTLAMRDDRTGKTYALALQQLAAKSASPDAPLSLAAHATYSGVAFNLGGEVGPLARLQQPDADTPWPVKLTLAAAGATVAVDGALTHPLQGRGYTLALHGTIPDLTAVAPLLPGIQLPPLHDVHLATRLSDTGGPTPRVEAATLHLGPADLGAYVGGLRIVSVDIDAPKQDEPVHIDARASMADTPVTLAATIGVPGALLAAPGQPAATAPVPVDLTLQAANASLTVKGAVAHPETLSGADLAVNATIPDLSELSSLAHRRLPAVTRIAFQGHLADAAGGFRHGATLRDVGLTSADGDLSGDIGVDAGPPRALTGKLHADRIDADALLAAASKPVTNPPPAAAGAPPGEASGAPPPPAGKGTAPPVANNAPPPPGASGSAPPVANDAPPPPTANGTAPPVASNAPPPPVGNGTTPSTADGAPLPQAAQPAGAGRLFPDTPIPFGLLRQANADLALSIGDLKTGSSDYQAIDLRVTLQDGKLQIAPFSARLPEGPLDASLNVDATAAAPPVALKLTAPGLEVAPLLAAAGLPGYASGKLEVYADLRGVGDTPHAIAAGLDGSLGLAMQNGTIDTALLQRLLGPVLQRANLPGLLARGGSSDLRCFALRADAQNGVADLRTLVLNSAVLSMDGSGSVNLGEETLGLRLRPQGRVAGTVIVVPLQLTGPIQLPDVKLNALGAAESNVGTVAGAVVGSATPLGLLGGMLGGGKLLNTGSKEGCAGPLALARGEATPAAPAGPTSSAAVQPKPSAPGKLLHDLFR